MGLRALLGVEGADGTYSARHVHYDGCPTVIVPALSYLVHEMYGRDRAAVLARLMTNDWRSLTVWPQVGAAPRQLACKPIDGRAEPQSGCIATDGSGDREWAYLFGDHRLHVYLGVEAVQPFTGRWVPWACWSVDELPGLSIEELLDVQRRGYTRQWIVSHEVRDQRVIQGIGGRW